MADEVAQAPAVPGLETAQALPYQQLQVFPGFILCRLYHAICYRSFRQFLCITCPSPLAISLPLLVVFTVFRPLVFFGLLRSLLHISR